MSHLSFGELRNIARFLGISTENKTAEDLGTLIKEATTKKPPSQAPNVIDPNALSKHFEEGRFTDCSIRVKLKEVPIDQAADRPPKRLRSGTSESLGAEPDRPADEEEENVRVMKAHAVILASRSPYFERAMGGEWRESQDRSFDVEVADEQDFMTFRRLIKLCYGSTFIKEGDRDLDFSELVRLIHVANAFECMDAVKQCVAALINGDLDWEGALQCVELTDMLKGVEGMADLAKKASGVIVKEVGPVHKLFVPSDEEGVPGVLGGLKLSDKVKDMSAAAFEALISSDGLQIKMENEAFWLLLAWVEAQSDESEEGKQELFARMAQSLHFDCMDPGYILLMVSKHPRIIAAGLESKALRMSLIRANLARRTSDDVKLFDRKMTLNHMPLEWTGGKPEWTFDVKFTATELAAIEPGKKCRKIVGLAVGLPWSVSAKRRTATDSEGQRLGVYTMCSRPFEWMTLAGGVGFYFNYKIEVGVGAPHNKTFVSRKWIAGEGLGGTVGAWDNVFREGRGWLVDGQLHVKLTVTTANDQGPSTLTTDA